MATPTNMQQLRGTSAAFASANPTLLAGQIAFVTDLNKIKIGDGSTAFNALPYISVALGDVTGLVDGNGKLNTNLLPSLSIGEVKEVTYTDSETVGEGGVTAFAGIVSAESGDFAIVTTAKGASETDADYHARQIANGDGWYVYVGNTSGADAYNAANWKFINLPGSAIHSVNGKYGQNITLGTDDMAEGNNNLYYTPARFNAAFSAKSSADLRDGATILHTTDTIDGGVIEAPQS